MLSRVHAAQDFLAETCYGDEDGIISEEKKRVIVKINDALTPWIRLLAKCCTGRKPFERLTAAWAEHPAPERRDESVTVYARVNLNTQDMYVGETGGWEERIKQHFMATVRHSEKRHGGRRCRGCREHTKYLRHRGCEPHAWIMIPLTICADKYEAKRVERYFVRTWKPSLNAGDKPFWLMKRDTYARTFRTTSRRQPHRRGREVPPWKRTTQPSKAEKRRLPLLTTFEVDGKTYHDLGQILKAYAPKPPALRTASITVSQGRKEITRWERIRARYGESYTVELRADGTKRTMLLGEWTRDAKGPGKRWRLYVRPTITVEEVDHDHENLLAEIEAMTTTLEKLSDEELAFFWRCRKSLDRMRRMKLRTMIWDECERRYDGLTRKPIEVRMPYFEQIDARGVKAHIQQAIESTSWPDYLKQWHASHARIVTESQPSLEDILCNVNKPWHEHHGCCCKKVCAKLKQEGHHSSLPMTDGHVFFTGREYDGPHRAALNVCAANVPQQTMWNVRRAWERAREALPGAARMIKRTVFIHSG